jgi:hypothetical protein
MTWLYARLGQLGTALLLLAIAMGAVWWGYSTWASGKTAKVENRLNRETTEAVINTVEVANAAAENANKSAAEIDAETKELANEVLSAPAGQRNAAARRAVCGMRAYRSHPECAGVRPADPGQPAD